MSFFHSLSSRFLESMEKRAAVLVHEHLQALSSEDLAKAGISKQLLSQGPAAYPWREEAVSIKTKASVTSLPVSNENAICVGIAELKACSDAELHDLGISRGEIAHVVRYGRPGVDRVKQDGGQAAA